MLGPSCCALAGGVELPDHEDLLVVLDSDTSTRSRIEIAAVLAERFAAHLVGPVRSARRPFKSQAADLFELAPENLGPLLYFHFKVHHWVTGYSDIPASRRGPGAAWRRGRPTHRPGKSESVARASDIRFCAVS
jgi:hypothetical protein